MSEASLSKNLDKRSTETYKLADEYWKNVEATNCGMLGNLPQVNLCDIQGSKNFLKTLLKLKPTPGRKLGLDCGAGIGRVSKNLLMNEFEKVDLLEQNTKFCEIAKEKLESSGQLGEIYNLGLQDFKSCDKLYDVIWIQWVLGHILDSDLIDFFKRISAMLNKNGIIVVKENFTAGNEIVPDNVDSSITRPLSHFKDLLKQANLRIIKEMRQTNFPKELFPVHMIALRRMK